VQSRLILVTCAALSLAIIVSTSFAGEVQLLKGTPISQVRAQLLKEGWVPVRIDKKDKDDGVRTKDADDVQEMFKAGYVEIESCTGADHEDCIFNYQKNGQCLRIEAMGEYHPPQGEPELFRWSMDCPD
jgi:hypothetical protein